MTKFPILLGAIPMIVLSSWLTIWGLYNQYRNISYAGISLLLLTILLIELFRHEQELQEIFSSWFQSDQR